MEGDLERAMAAVDEAMTLASGPTAEYDVYECRAQRATFLMFAGDLDAAEAELREALSYLEARALEGTEPDRLSIRGNLGLCLIHQGRFREAVELLRPVVDTARTFNLQANVALSAPPLSFALAEQGVEVGTLLSEGLRAAFRQGQRSAVTAAGFAGRALNACGADPSFLVLAEALGFRLSQGPPLNALERNLFAPVLDQRLEASRPLVNFIRATIRATSRVADA